MVVAVAFVPMVQAAPDEVVHVVAVRHRLVPAARAVDVPRLVARRARARVAGVRVLGVDGDHVVVDVVTVRVVELAVVEEVDVALVDDGGVPAARAVDVLVRAVVGVVLGGAHGSTVRRADTGSTQPLMRLVPRERGGQRPDGWRTANPRAERGAACQRLPARRRPEVSKRRPATTMYTWPAFA